MESQGTSAAGKRTRNSKKSIETWGPAAWTWLHTVAFDYSLCPTSYDRQQAVAFLDSFARAMPCPSCRRHFNLFAAADLAQGAEGEMFSCREAYSRATVRWHNSVNELLGKPLVPYVVVAREYDDTVTMMDDDCLAMLNASPPASRPSTFQRKGSLAGSPLGVRPTCSSGLPALPAGSRSPLVPAALPPADPAFTALTPSHLVGESLLSAMGLPPSPRAAMRR